MLSKIVLLMAVPFVLTACQSPGELRAGAPKLDQTTNTPAERVAGCVGDKLEASPVARQGGLLPGAALSSRPTANGYSISVTQTGGFGGTDTIILVDISKVDNQNTRVQLFTHFLFGGDGGMSPLVRACL